MLSVANDIAKSMSAPVFDFNRHRNDVNSAVSIRFIGCNDDDSITTDAKSSDNWPSV